MARVQGSMLSQFCIVSNSRQTNWASGRGAIIMSVSCCGVCRLNQSFLYGFEHQVLLLLFCDKSHNLPDINRWSTTLALMLDINFHNVYCYCYVGTLDTHRSVVSACTYKVAVECRRQCLLNVCRFVHYTQRLQTLANT